MADGSGPAGLWAAAGAAGRRASLARPAWRQTRSDQLAARLNWRQAQAWRGPYHLEKPV